jgi:hypothetical protein
LIEGHGNSMGVSVKEIVTAHPQLYHMAEANSWGSIMQRGLLSTTALLDLFEYKGQQRAAIESKHRPESVTISHPKYGEAVIRDQKPMRESALKKCLVGMGISEWYRLLNERVFFWLTLERVETLLNARAYRGLMHTVLTVDTAEMLRRHSDRITLSPINSGSTIYNPQERGPNTFLSLDEYPYEERRKKRGRQEAIAELAVSYSVPDISELVLRVEHRIGSEIVELLFKR